MKISILNSKTYRGYQCYGQNITRNKRDCHEAIDFLADYSDQASTRPYTYNPSFPLHGYNQWPILPANFRKISEDYVQEMLFLGEKLASIFALGLSLNENYFKPFMNDSFWGMRIIGYPPEGSVEHGPANGYEFGEGSGLHTDYGCLTIVLQDEVGGLEVQKVDGNWIKCPPVPGTFLINIGDMLAHWTNGRFKSTPHKVRNLSREKFRVSVPFFLRSQLQRRNFASDQ